MNQAVQEGMRLLGRLFEKTPGLVFFAPERDPETGEDYIAVVIKEQTPELAKSLPERIRGVPLRIRVSSYTMGPPEGET